MIEYILLALVIGAVCNGIYISTQEKMIFHFVRRWLDKVFITYHVETKQEQYYSGGTSYYDVVHVPKTIQTVSKIYYPILYCPRCMPSIYGTAILLAYLPFHVELLWQIPIVLCMAVTVSTILSEQYE
jgi:hypothetical protein